jgi:hypothetical protein
MTASNLRAREGREEGKKHRASILTPTRSSWSAFSMAGSGRAAARRADESWWQYDGGRAQVLRVYRAGGGCGLGEKLGHGGHLNRPAGHLSMRARGSARREQHRTPAELGLESESGAGKGRPRRAGPTYQRENGGERRKCDTLGVK